MECQQAGRIRAQVKPPPPPKPKIFTKPKEISKAAKQKPVQKLPPPLPRNPPSGLSNHKINSASATEVENKCELPLPCTSSIACRNIFDHNGGSKTEKDGSITSAETVDSVLLDRMEGKLYSEPYIEHALPLLNIVQAGPPQQLVKNRPRPIPKKRTSVLKIQKQETEVTSREQKKITELSQSEEVNGRITVSVISKDSVVMGLSDPSLCQTFQDLDKGTLVNELKDKKNEQTLQFDVSVSSDKTDCVACDKLTNDFPTRPPRTKSKRKKSEAPTSKVLVSLDEKTTHLIPNMSEATSKTEVEHNVKNVDLGFQRISWNRHNSYQSAFGEDVGHSLDKVIVVGQEPDCDVLYDDVVVPESGEDQVCMKPKYFGDSQTESDRSVKLIRNQPKQILRDSDLERYEGRTDVELSYSLNEYGHVRGSLKQDNPVFIPPPPPPYSELDTSSGNSEVQSASKMVQTSSGSLNDISVLNQEHHTLSESMSEKCVGTKLQHKLVPVRKAPPPPIQKKNGVLKENFNGTRPLPARPAPSLPDQTELKQARQTEYDEHGYIAPANDGCQSIIESNEYAYVDVPLYDDNFQKKTIEKEKKKMRKSSERSSHSSGGSSLGSHLYELVRSKTSNRDSQSSVFYCDVEDIKNQTENLVPESSPISMDSKSNTLMDKDINSANNSEPHGGTPQVPPRSKRKSSQLIPPPSSDDNEEDDYIYPENLNDNSDDANNNCIEELPPILPHRQLSVCRSHLGESQPIEKCDDHYTIPEEPFEDCREQQEVSPVLPPRKSRIHENSNIQPQSNSSDYEDDYIYPDESLNSNDAYNSKEYDNQNDKITAANETKDNKFFYQEGFIEREDCYSAVGPNSSSLSPEEVVLMPDELEIESESFRIRDSMSDSECVYPDQSTPVKVCKAAPLQCIKDSNRPASWTGDDSYISMEKNSMSELYMNQIALLDSENVSVSVRDSSSTIHSEVTDSDEECNDDESSNENNMWNVFCIAEEIMTSEKAFVDKLRLLNIDFRAAVSNETAHFDKPIVPSSVMNHILKYLPQLQNFNEELLKDLTQRIKHWNEDPRVADIFVKKGPFLKLYTSYIREFEGMCSALDDARKKYPEFDKVVKNFEASARCQNLALKHFMLKPIQRIPQYRLLLQDYMKHLSEDSLDYKDTQIAMVIVSEVAEHANQSMKYGDNFKKLWEIQNNLIGQFEVIKPGRSFVKEGILQKLSRKEMQPRMFILLSDVLMYTTPVSGGYKLNNVIPLAGMRVSMPTKEDFQNEFSILSTQRSFTISASTPQERDSWLDALKKTVEENVLRRSSFDLHKLQSPAVMIDIDIDFKLGTRAPVWVPDARVSMCMLCTSEFTVAFRRHHCRACGKVVCGSCSDYRAPLRYLKYSAARVCCGCYETLSKEFDNVEEDDVSVTASSDAKSSPFSKSSIKSRFRGFKMGSFGKGKRKRPAVLQEVQANSDDADMSGYLKVWKGRKWKKMWFVLKGKALYTYKASEDAAATQSKVLLGYEVKHFNTWFEGVEQSLVFELVHPGTPSIIFRTESAMSREKWMKAMQDATIP